MNNNGNEENYMWASSSADSSPKKFRKIYNNEETEKLEAAFQSNHFPGRDYRLKLAKEMDVSPKNIQVWFQNRRAREKNLRHKASGCVEDPIERMRHQWTYSSRTPLSTLLNRSNVPPLHLGHDEDSSCSSSSFAWLPDGQDPHQPQPDQSLVISEVGRSGNEPSPSFNDVVRALNEPVHVRFRSPLNSTSNVSEISNSSFMELLKSVDGDLLADYKIASNDAPGSAFINFLSPNSDLIFEF